MMPQNSKVVQKSCEIKMPGKIFALKCTISVFLGTTPTSEVNKGKESQTTVVKVEKQVSSQEVNSTASSNEPEKQCSTIMITSHKNQADNSNLRETSSEDREKSEI